MLSRKLFRLSLFGLALLFMATLLVAGGGPSPAEAQTNTLMLSVVSARDEADFPPNPCPPGVAPGVPPQFCGSWVGKPVTEYKYLINVDNTGEPGTGDPAADGCLTSSPGYPDSCQWPSVREVPGAAPIYTQGDQLDFALDANGNPTIGIDLPDGKYLISVLAGEYKMGGAHFSVPLPDPDVDSNANVLVELQPHPLPAATMRIRVYEDISPVNGQFDAPAESGLADFFAVIKDPAGDLSTDVFGNPLCTEYDANGDPIPGTGTTDCLYSDANGDIVVPNLGPNRYDVEVAPPAGEGWLHTSTLEGSWSWDSWLAEGGSGLDNEFVVAGEPFPWTQFGFVSPCSFGNTGDRCPANDDIPAASGGVSGTIVGASIYLPQQNGLPYQGGIWGGLNGTKVTGPIEDAWVALSDLQNGDTAIYVGQADTDGNFNITGVPDGNYFFTWWDEPLHHLLDWTQVTVSNGEIFDMGAQQLTGWFTRIDGYVFNDLNRNGVKDAGEPGIANYLVGLRDRDNSEIDRMSIAVTTDATGYYVFERAYPMSSWMVLEAYNDTYYTTGITYQVENQPSPTTILGDGVDVGVLPILGQSGRLDWGVHKYDASGGSSYATAVMADGPAHYYRLGESSGSTAFDETGGSNGTYGSTVTLGAPGLLSNSSNTAAEFDGASATDFVDTGVTSFTDGAFSVEAWVNAASIGTVQHRIVAKDEIGTPGAWILWFNQGALRFQARNSTDTTWVIAQAPVTPAAGTTHHVVGVFNGADLILYLDGVEVARVPLGTATTNTNTLPITIGADSDTSSARGHIFDGAIDEVAIYGYALPQGRIQAHFAAANAPPAADPPNGGIVGSVFYETTRNEFDPQYEAVEPWSPGVPGLTMNLYATVACGTTGAPCDELGHELAPDGSLAKGPWLNEALTETWIQPVDCTARDANGIPLPSPAVQDVLAPYSGGFRCLEGPLMGTQFQSGFAELDGNWGFTEILNDPVTGAPLSEPVHIPAGDYLVEMVIPQDDFGRDKYELVREETVNVFGGDQYVPAVPPPSCAGALHTVDVAGAGIDGYPEVDLGNGVTVPASIPYGNDSFAAEGGSPFEGTARPLCDVKLVSLGNGKSIAPTFNLFTEVPVPGKWKGYIIDDLALSVDRTSLTFGEKAGLANSPVGVYDFNNRLVTTLTSDYNGTYEILLPSTHSVNCPSPSGVCASMYYILGNDPGQPGQLNENYNPQYRTIGATFEIWPGLIIPSDLAPTQMVVGVLNPATTQTAPADCSLPDTTPQLFAVSRPYANVDPDALPPLSDTFTIWGQGFGNPAVDAPPTVALDAMPLTILSWNATQIDVEVAATTPAGPYQLEITNAAGDSTINGLTFHVLGAGYNPRLYEVGPGPEWDYHTIQDGVDAASSFGGGRGAIVVVYPGAPELWNPTGAYFENLVINQSIKLQGVGPGGGGVLGSAIDGRGVAGDTAYAEEWRARVQGLTWDGNQNIYEGPVIYYLGEDGEFESNIRRRSMLDGFTIQGGDQQGFPNNLVGDGVLNEAIAVQGGGIFANAYIRYLQISNNILQSNGGAYAGAIRLGTPHLPGALNDNQNDGVRIVNNRVHSNGGTNLAGAVGIFSGSEGYEVAYNDICGNFSAEYGGGISHYGFSPNGAIHHNRITFNRAYDEGGGIMIAGELPADPAILSTGAGPVDVYANLIQANLANDDGGGLRFLMAGDFEYNVYNNIVVDNISTHEGGGVSLNDAPDVRFYNNTVMKNITTATAVTSNGSPAPAGLSSSRNSVTLQATLPGGSPIFSDPLLFNNIFWDNRAGSWTGGGISGIGQPGDPTPIYRWDLGVADGTGILAPTNSVLQTTTGTNATCDGVSIICSDPMVENPFEVSVQAMPWRGNANFVDALVVSTETRVDMLGDFHLAAGSPAINKGAPAKAGVAAPADDFDGDLRPVESIWDIGADEIGGVVAPPNEPPTASFTFSCNGLACEFVSTSTDPDGTITSWEWDFGDGIGSASIANPSYTYSASGTYNVQLTVNDDGAVPASDTAAQLVVASDAAEMHIGNLAPDTNIVNNSRWDAIVTIVVHDTGHNLVDDATVSVEITRIRKNNGNLNTANRNCTTVGGQCEVSLRINSSRFEDEVTFTVLKVTHASLTYAPDDNDVDPVSIVVSKP